MFCPKITCSAGNSQTVGHTQQFRSKCIFVKTDLYKSMSICLIKKYLKVVWNGTAYLIT